MPEILLKFLPYIAVLAVVAGAYTIGHVKGTASCQIKDATKETIAIKKDGENYDKNYFRDSKDTDVALDRRIDKFVRSSN